MAFIVGELAYIESHTANNKTKCRVYASPGSEQQGRFALDCATKILDFFTEYFAIEYPLPKLDLLAIFDFAAGAMVNTNSAIETPLCSTAGIWLFNI